MSHWTVEYLDGTKVDVKTSVGDVVAFEKAHARPIGRDSLSDITWLVWRAATRLGLTGDEFQVWADGVNDYDPVVDAPLVEPGAPFSASPGSPALPPPS